MTSVCVAIPVLGRADLIEPLTANLIASQVEVPLWPLFVVSPGRDDDLDAVRATGEDYAVVDWEPEEGGDFARKINLAARETDADWFFAGATDLRFERGWADEAIRVADKSGCGFVATNDLGHPRVRLGRHATHPLVSRAYLERGTIDEPGKLYHEGYSHWFVDDEATETAKARGEFAAALGSVVEHLHPIWRKGESDWVYELGQARAREDAALLRARRPLWGGRSRGLARRERVR